MEEYYSLCDRLSSESPENFLSFCVINSHPEPKRFGDIIEPWQKEIVIPKAAALAGLMGLREYHGPRSFLTVLPRGHDKSSLEGRFASCALVYSKTRIEGYLCAADRDQGALLLRAMQDEANLNPWYGKQLDFQRNRVIGPRGTLEVVPADAKSAYGFRGNLYIMDEITHWKSSDLWEAVVSGREKVPGSLLICITNAGLKGSWQERLLLDVAKADPEEWVVFDRPGHLASWMTADRIAKVRALLPDLVARRVLDNEWIDESEDSGYLRVEDIRACVQESVSVTGFRVGGAQYVAAVDYGATNDRTAMCLLYQDEAGIVTVARMDTLQGSPGAPAPIVDVERWMYEVNQQYRPLFVVDPHQMEGSIQKLQYVANVKRIEWRGGATNTDIAMNLRNLVVNKRIRWNPRHGVNLADELAGLVVKITPHGYRFDHRHGKHDDQAFALAAAAYEAVQRPYHKMLTGRAPELLARVTSPISLFGR